MAKVKEKAAVRAADMATETVTRADEAVAVADETEGGGARLKAAGGGAPEAHGLCACGVGHKDRRDRDGLGDHRATGALEPPPKVEAQQTIEILVEELILAVAVGVVGMGGRLSEW